MADEKIIFSMTGVSKIYPPNKQVLKDIYLSFFYGAKIGVLGLNGAGKSSLLRIIAGIDKDFQGEVVSDLSFSVGLLEQEPKKNQQLLHKLTNEQQLQLMNSRNISDQLIPPDIRLNQTLLQLQQQQQ